MQSIAASTSATAVLPASSRAGLVLENSDANRCFILLGGGTVSATNYSFSLAQNENALLPAEFDGAVAAIWGTAGAGALKVTEF